MRIVLDTNVLIAALISNGVCAQVFESVVATHEIISAESLLLELHEKLIMKFHYSQEDADAAIALIKSKVQLVIPVPLSQSVCRDPDDDLVLATAVTGDAHCIITGDKDLLVLKHFEGVDIIRPAEFAEYERTNL